MLSSLKARKTVGPGSCSHPASLRYLVGEWLPASIFSRKNTFVDLLLTIAADHVHLSGGWTFRGTTALWPEFPRSHTGWPGPVVSGQTGIANQCLLASFCLVMENHQSQSNAEAQNRTGVFGCCFVESVAVAKLGLVLLASLRRYTRPVRSSMMSWSSVSSGRRACCVVKRSGSL